jgi:ribose transport system ATP-binding protein
VGALSADPTQSPAAPVISARGLSKTFGGGRRVLHEVGIDLFPGEVHALLGQNGSGKSTFIKLISGNYEPDDGEGDDPRLEVRGEDVPLPLTPHDAGELNLVFVHQDLPTARSATILENLRLGRFETTTGWRIPWRREREQAQAAMRSFGVVADPDQLVSELSDVERALIVILRALQGLDPDRPGLLVLDEPTAYLPRDGVDRVFDAIRRVAGHGHAVLLVTHRLEEVFAITDRITVIRDGRVVERGLTAETDERGLVRAILGFDMDDLYPELDAESRQTVLTARSLSGGRVAPIDFDLHQGEILGLTGLIGAGHEEIPYLLFGAGSHPGDGTVSVDAREFSQVDLSPRVAMAAGVVLLPADRRNASGVADATVAENVSLPALSDFFDRGFLRVRHERRRVKELLGRFEVTPPDTDRLLGTLSGGNQQKALLAKWFQLEPRVFILHEPTQGVDVGARRAIFRLIHEAAAGGAGVILVSTEYEDLANLCHRVVVFRNGAAAATLQGAGLTEERIVAHCVMQGSNGEQAPAGRPGLHGSVVGAEKGESSGT